MLVLTRKQNEGIIIGDDIVVTVLDIEKDKIRLGIQAPRNIRVIREELLVEIKEENRLAVQSDYNPLDLMMSQLADKNGSGEHADSDSDSDIACDDNDSDIEK
ncbi:MAG: carbon storage regulator CsrA [Eubacteriales bacterium]|jgi:carbon storage regulator|nr:carbon storage regulator CsrA [Clostridiales bacterium]